MKRYTLPQFPDLLSDAKSTHECADDPGDSRDIVARDHPFSRYTDVGVGIGMLVGPSEGCSECWLELARRFGALIE